MENMIAVKENIIELRDRINKEITCASKQRERTLKVGTVNGLNMALKLIKACIYLEGRKQSDHLS